MKTIIFAVSLVVMNSALIASPTLAQGFPSCVYSTSDPDGDGYGWENNFTCLVDANTGTEMTGTCEDRGSYPWGWNPLTLQSCRLDNNTIPSTNSSIGIDLNGSWDCREMKFLTSSQIPGWQRLARTEIYGEDGRSAGYSTMNLIFKGDELEIRYELDFPSYVYQRTVKTTWQFAEFRLTVPETFPGEPLNFLNKEDQYQFAFSNDEYFFENGDHISASGSAPNQPAKKMHFYKNTHSRMTCILYT